ncbi:MAG: hypothetical protein ABI809_01400 [Caldimonas sp.]
MPGGLTIHQFDEQHHELAVVDRIDLRSARCGNVDRFVQMTRAALRVCVAQIGGGDAVDRQRERSVDARRRSGCAAPSPAGRPGCSVPA